MESVLQDSGFKVVQRFRADHADVTYTQYESERTGLRVAVADRKGPMVCHIH